MFLKLIVLLYEIDFLSFCNITTSDYRIEHITISVNNKEQNKVKQFLKNMTQSKTLKDEN